MLVSKMILRLTVGKLSVKQNMHGLERLLRKHMGSIGHQTVLRILRSWSSFVLDAIYDAGHKLDVLENIIDRVNELLRT